MIIPDALPRLARGNHPPGSGKACAMNAVSYIAGDDVITDMPPCVDPFLAKVAQHLNDSICEHDLSGVRGARRGALLCGACSHKVWLFLTKLIGTAQKGPTSGLYRRVTAVMVADTLRRYAPVSDGYLFPNLFREARQPLVELLGPEAVMGISIHLSSFLGGGDSTSEAERWLYPGLGRAVDALRAYGVDADDVGHAYGAWRAGSECRSTVPDRIAEREIKQALYVYEVWRGALRTPAPTTELTPEMVGRVMAGLRTPA